jgi:hypothetical protein
MKLFSVLAEAGSWPQSSNQPLEHKLHPTTFKKETTMQTQFPSVRIQNLLRNASDGRFDHRALIDTVDRECCLAAANRESGYNMLQQLQVTAQVWEDSLTRKSSSTLPSSSLFRKTVHEILYRVQAGIAVQRKFEEGQIQETQVQNEYCTQVAEGRPKCLVVFYPKMGDEVDAEEGRESFKSITG